MRDDTVNVLYLLDEINQNRLGGSERQFMIFQKTLNNSSRINPHVVFLRDSDVSAIPIWRNVPNILNLNSFKNPGFILKIYYLMRFISENKISIVHTLLVDSTIIGAMLKILSPRLILISTQRNLGYLHTGFRRTLIKLAYKLSNAVVVNATKIKETLVNLYGTSEDKIHVISNIYEQREADKDYHDSEFEKIRASHKHISLIIANPKAIKGFYELVETATILKGKLDIAFVVLGAGADFEKARSTIVEKSLENEIYLLGFKTEINYYLQRVDFAILPSRSEGYSNALIEYIYHGVPTIATNVGGNSEALEGGKYGILVEPRSPAALTDAVMMLVKNQDRYKAAALLGMQDFKTKFTVENSISKHSKLYEELWYNNRK